MSHKINSVEHDLVLKSLYAHLICIISTSILELFEIKNKPKIAAGVAVAGL